MEVEHHFAGRGWLPDWRGVVLEDHHYHSTAYEVLGCTAGTATLKLGGDEGVSVDVERGDALLIPAGVSHAQLIQSTDFQLVGAYALGQR